MSVRTTMLLVLIATLALLSAAPASAEVAPTTAESRQEDIRPQPDDPDDGESSPIKDLVGAGLLVAIVGSAAFGLARSSRRLR